VEERHRAVFWVFCVALAAWRSRSHPESVGPHGGRRTPYSTHISSQQPRRRRVLSYMSLVADTAAYVGGSAWEAFLLAETGAELGAVGAATMASGGGVAAVAFAGVTAEAAVSQWRHWYFNREVPAPVGGDVMSIYGLAPPQRQPA
jgi:hypothetical protein